MYYKISEKIGLLDKNISSRSVRETNGYLYIDYLNGIIDEDFIEVSIDEIISDFGFNPFDTNEELNKNDKMIATILGMQSDISLQLIDFNLLLGCVLDMQADMLLGGV